MSVEPFHLFRYLDEQAFRYNQRKNMTDFDRFKFACSQIVGKRLTWDVLTGTQEENPPSINGEGKTTAGQREANPLTL